MMNYEGNQDLVELCDDEEVDSVLNHDGDLDMDQDDPDMWHMQSKVRLVWFLLFLLLLFL